MHIVHHRGLNIISRTRRRAFCTSFLLPVLERAASDLGMFGIGSSKADNEWKEIATRVGTEISDKTPLEEVNRMLGILASRNVSIGSFWAELFDHKLNPKIKVEKTRISDLVILIQTCNQVDFRSQVVIDKLIAGLLENETVWIISPPELDKVSNAISQSYTQNQALFAEIGNRVCLEISDFSTQQLISILDAFSNINFTNEEMTRLAARRFLAELHSLTTDQKVRISETFGKLRFRSDTFFKSFVTDLLGKEKDSVTCHQICTVLVAMQRLKMNVGSSQWWNREADFSCLSEIAYVRFNPDTIAQMNAKDLSACSQVVKKHADEILKRMHHLLSLDPLSRSHRHLAVIMESLSRNSKQGSVQVSNLRWIAEWLCGNVFILPVHDIASINRALGRLGFKDHSFHKIWIPYYLERMDDITKDDISLISDTFNDIGMSDKLMGGRHFFYKLGKRFQELSVESNGEKELAVRRKFRTLQRLG